MTESFSDRVLRSPSVKLFLHVDDAISPFYDVMHILNDVIRNTRLVRVN